MWLYVKRNKKFKLKDSFRGKEWHDIEIITKNNKRATFAAIQIKETLEQLPNLDHLLLSSFIRLKQVSFNYVEIVRH